MNSFVYQIRNLRSSYPGSNKVVLELDELDIPNNKLVVFLGASGVGKSTLLETLGLMNNTISKGKIRFQPANVDFGELWRSPELLPRIRNRHMSFVFQENNLLENLGALDNVMISHYIQGRSREEAIAKLTPWLRSLNMEFVLENTDVRRLSVGQKQRLSFIRAASVDYTVLFGDEPTGNLDEVNGEILMSKLRGQLKAEGSQKLAIIVSHNIDLTLKSADLIFVLTKDKNSSTGTINAEHVFVSDSQETPFDQIKSNSYFLRNPDVTDHVTSMSWSRLGTSEKIDPRQKIVELLTP